MIIMKTINIELQKSCIAIYSNSNKLVSHAIIVDFPVQNNENQVRPFLIFPAEAVSKYESAYLQFSQIDKGSKYTLSFDKDFVNANTIDEFVVYPIAPVLNDLDQKGIKLEYLGINENIHITEKNNNTINEIATLTCYSLNERLIDLTDSPAIYKMNNITSIFGSINNESQFIIDDINGNLIPGSPVFIVDQGGYFANNSVYMGNRVIFIGIVKKIKNGFCFVTKSDDLDRIIKSKFNFYFNETENKSK